MASLGAGTKHLPMKYSLAAGEHHLPKGRIQAMTVYDTETEERMRQAFKHINRFMIIMWRLGFGVWLKSKAT